MRLPQSGMWADHPSWPLLKALISYQGSTTSNGAVTGLTIVDDALLNEPSYDNMTVKILSGPAAGQIREITAHAAPSNILILSVPFTNATGAVQQITARTDYVILSSGEGSGGSGSDPLSYMGTVTAIPGANQFIIPSLSGIGAGAFIALAPAEPWIAYVFRDAAGAADPPQGEFQDIKTYDTLTGEFTTNPFTAPVAVGDEIIIMHPSLVSGGMSSIDAIYFDEILGNAGIGSDNGTPENPTNNMSDAITLLGIRNLGKLVLSGGGAHTVTIPHGFNYQIVGNSGYIVTVSPGGTVIVNSDLVCAKLVKAGGSITIVGNLFTTEITSTGAGTITVEGYTKANKVTNSGGGEINFRGGSQIDQNWDNLGGGHVYFYKGTHIGSTFQINGTSNVFAYGNASFNMLIHSSTGSMYVFGNLRIPTTTTINAAGGSLIVYGESDLIGDVKVTNATASLTLIGKSRIYGIIEEIGTIVQQDSEKIVMEKEIDLTGITADMSISNVHGNVIVKNLAGAFIVNIYILKGCQIEIDASCTAGTVNLYGDTGVVLINNSGGTTVNDNIPRSLRLQGGVLGSVLCDGTEQTIYERTDEEEPYLFAGGFNDFTGANSGAGEDTIIRVYVKIDGTNYRLIYEETFLAAGLPNPVCIPFPRSSNTTPIPQGTYIRQDIKVTIEQVAEGAGWNTLNFNIIDATRL